jgi:hypothetical protein
MSIQMMISCWCCELQLPMISQDKQHTLDFISKLWFTLLLVEPNIFLRDEVIWKSTLLVSFSFSSLLLDVETGSQRTFKWMTDRWTKPKDSRIATSLALRVKLKRRCRKSDSMASNFRSLLNNKILFLDVGPRAFFPFHRIQQGYSATSIDELCCVRDKKNHDHYFLRSPV